MDFEKRATELAGRTLAAQKWRRRGRMYSAELRRDIDAFVHDRVATGRSLYGVSRELGVNPRQRPNCRADFSG